MRCHINVIINSYPVIKMDEKDVGGEMHLSTSAGLP
jgi:hypothetical protein